MLYIPNIDDYLKILTDAKVNNFVAINFSKYFKTITQDQHFDLLNCFISF